jgi:hypothetical protein
MEYVKKTFPENFLYHIAYINYAIYKIKYVLIYDKQRYNLNPRWTWLATLAYKPFAFLKCIKFWGSGSDWDRLVNGQF